MAFSELGRCEVLFQSSTSFILAWTVQGDVHGLEAGASLLSRLLLNFGDALEQHLRLGEKVNPQILLHPEEAVVVPRLDDVAHVGCLHGIVRLFDFFLPFLLFVCWQRELCVVQNGAVRWSAEDELAENFRLFCAKKYFVEQTIGGSRGKAA